ncbi:MAG: glycerol-3-phosphate 1-O-acyltransferase PlsY [Arenicella sp.]
MIAVIFGFIAYLIGSISSAIILSKIFGLTDPREVGSGNPGATNVLRSGNKKAAALTLLGDMLKGFLPVSAAMLLSGSNAIIAITAIGAFLGHLYPLYYKFKGGKGVATAFGVFLALNIYAFIVMAIVWLVTAKIFKMSSLASLTAASSALIVSFFMPSIPLLGATFAIVALLFWKHRDNIERLRSGTESKIGDKS